MKIFLAGSSLVVALGVVWAASIPFSYECTKEAGFIMDPNQHKRFGYITDFDGAGLALPLKKDLEVSLPFKATYRGLGPIQTAASQPNTAKVVGILENFVWAGGAGDPIAMQFYLSQENSALLKALMNSALKTNIISAIGWWIGDYDQETKAWYEATKPSSPAIKGTIQGSLAQPVLNVELTPVSLKNLNGEVQLYKVELKMIPRPHEVNPLSFANSSTKSVTKSWGLP